MLNAITTSALASLAIAEAMTPDPVVKAAPAPKPCDCNDCYNLECAGFTLPTGPTVQCGAEVIINDPAQRWALAAMWEEDMEYAMRRYEMKRREYTGYYDQPEPATREEVIEAFLAAA
jgi:hypothetical protein